jgi:hypothetical protein
LCQLEQALATVAGINACATHKNVTHQKLPILDANRRAKVIATLTPQRLGKYLQTAHKNEQQALRLYVLNAKVGAALMTDLHYIEVALRNKFAHELAGKFGHEWYDDATFLVLLSGLGRDILQKAKKSALKHHPRATPLPPGKVIAELTFGFWHQLTDRKLEHSLWVPCLHKAFLPRKAPRRSDFNGHLEKLRQLRNRIAHHEPIFHMDLLDAQQRILSVGNLLSPETTLLMQRTSTVRREVMGVTSFRKRRGL